MNLKIPSRKKSQLTETQFAKATGILARHREFILSDEFWDVRDEISRRCPIPEGIQDTAHGQHYAAGYRDGYEAALKQLQLLAVEESQVEESTISPTRDTDLH